MHKLSRTSLAAVVCPSAPFLAPRLLRTAIPAAVITSTCLSSSSLQRATYATGKESKRLIRKVDHKQKKDRKSSMPWITSVEAETVHLLKKFREACDVRNIHVIMELYPTLLVAKALNSFDSRRITQTLHVRIRNEHVPGKRAEIYPFVQQVVSDLRNGLLEPHHYAYVHLFGIFKDCKRWDEGHELWQWMVQQDERHVSQAAYGAAIELMAYGGLMSLPDLEDLYADGLKRFPGTFAEYHLSPDAIVPDRAQLTTIAGIPTILLQGILTARILARDWKKAYLALDTALRIYPTQTPPRYFELFMTERPMTEAYAAFMVACRAGIPLRPTHVTTLITKLRAAIGASQSMADRIMLLRAIANAIYGHLEAGGRIESIHVGSFLRAFEQILPEPPVGKDYDGEAAEMRDALVVAAHEIVSGLIQAGMSPQIQPFDALISMSGKLRVPNLLSTTLQDVKTGGLELGPIGTRSVITSAGLLKDIDLIEQHWSRIVATAEENSGLIPFEDWITFTKACRRADHVDYFRSQLLKLPHTFTASTERALIQQIDSSEPASTDHESYEQLGLKELTSELSQLRSQVKNIEAVVMSGQPLDLHTNPFHIHIDPKYPSLAEEKDLRNVYDELTTDPHQPPPPPPPQEDGSPQPAALSPTGIRIDELRFRNWVTIHEMMDSAETYESDLKMAINVAIRSGKPLKGAPEILRLRKEDTIPRSRSELHTRIRMLRGSSPDDAMGWRKVGSEGPGELYKKTAKARMRKHIAKDAGETVVKTEETAPRLVYYVGLETDNDSPNGAKRRGSKIRKVRLSDGTTAEETVVQAEDGSEEGVENKGDAFPA